MLEPLGYSDEYNINAHVTITERVGVGYISFNHPRKGQPGCAVRTAVWDREGIHIDFDADGRIIGIELMDHHKAPHKL